MRKLLGTLTLFAIVVVVAGYWRGWFSISTDDGENNQTKLEVTIDRDAVKADTDRLKGGVRDLSEKIANRIQDDGDTAAAGSNSGAESNIDGESNGPSPLPSAGDQQPDLILPPDR